MILDGKKAAAELREELKKKIIELKSTYNTVPGLTVILIGEDSPSKIKIDFIIFSPRKLIDLEKQKKLRFLLRFL